MLDWELGSFSFSAGPTFMNLKNGAFAVLAASAMAACSGSQNPQAGAPQAPPPPPVVVEEAKPKPTENATEYAAPLRSLTATPIQPQVDGQIPQIFVKSGDRVRRGQ